MALASSLAPLGTSAPAFALPDLKGRIHRLDQYADHPVLIVAFLCNHCPYVRHIERSLSEFAVTSPATIVAICSNDTDDYPDDAPPGLTEQVARAGWTFPYLIDTDQGVAREYGAVCTPDFFGYGPERMLAYRGAFDRSTPKNTEPVDGSMLADAVRHIGRREPVPEPHRPSMGCGIKWKPGNEPA